MASAALFGAQAGAGLLAGFLGAQGANEAGNTVNHGQVNANAQNYTLYNQTRQDQAPWINAGMGAVNYLSYLLGIGGGANGQSSAGAPSTPQNKVSSIMWQGKSNGRVLQNGTGSFVWDPTSHNKRTYSFMYVDSNGNDVYQRTGGNKGDGSPNDYAIVGKDGNTTLAAQPPIGVQYGQGNGQPTDAMKNDPNFGSLMHDFSASDFQTDPGYAFRLAEGQKALDRSAASKGRLFSGATIKDSINYNSGAASQEFGNAYNRYQTNRATKYNQLASLAGMGQVSANTIAGATNNLANNNSSNIMNAAGQEANARASAYSSWANGITGAANAGQDWYAQTHPHTNTWGAPTSGAQTGTGVFY
jgi:hypothetical protein